MVAAALAGGPGAFSAIVYRYKEMVFGVALARLRHFQDAEDVTQTVLLEAYERLDRLVDPGRLAPWLRSIAIHRCIDLQRRGGLEESVADRLAGPAPLPTPCEQLEAEELRNGIMAAIGRLSATQRETVTLYYLSGYSQEEVAAMLEVPLGTVKYRLHAARKRLGKELLDMVDDVLTREAPKEDFAERVFGLLDCYSGGDHRWNETIAELRKIGTDGMEGFIKAFALPHARTRTWTMTTPMNTMV